MEAPSQEILFNVSGINLRGWSSGQAKKGTILALHGWLDNANSFLPLSKYLPKEWELICLDLVGHGFSDWRAENANYHFIDYVTDTLEVCAQLKDKPLVIMGHSLGAAIATIISTCPPENLKAAILIDGLGPLSAPEKETYSRYKSFLDHQSKVKAQKNHHYKTLDEVLNKRLIVSPMNKEAAKTILERSLEDTPSGWKWRSDPRHTGKNPTRFTEAQVLNFLENIRRPCFFIEATRGDFFHFKQKILPGRLKKAKLLKHIVLEGDHHIHCDKPKEVAQLIESFL